VSYGELTERVVSILQSTFELFQTATPRSERVRAHVATLVRELLSDHHLPVCHSVDYMVAATADLPKRTYYYRFAPNTDMISDTPHGDIVANTRRVVVRACIHATVNFDAGGDQVGFAPERVDDAVALLRDTAALLQRSADVGTTDRDARETFVRLYELAIEVGYLDPAASDLSLDQTKFVDIATVIGTLDPWRAFPSAPTTPALLPRCDALRAAAPPIDVATRALRTIATACRVGVCALLQRALVTAQDDDVVFPESVLGA
jgi:hypothetical protein